jgi:hypothetical protein
MKIDTLHPSGWEATRYMERYVNNIKPGSHTDWSETNIIYSPHEGNEEFDIPTYHLQTEEVTLFLANPNPLLVAEVTRQNTVKFFLHPEMASDKNYCEQIGIDPDSKSDEVLMVTPTSSTRTLLTKGKMPNFMIKTDLFRKHDRFIRRLKGGSVEHSVLISKELEGITSRERLPEYAFLPESIGVVLGHIQEGAGVILREIHPRPATTDARVLVPYFSLYANDLKSPDDRVSNGGKSP